MEYLNLSPLPTALPTSATRPPATSRPFHPVHLSIPPHSGARFPRSYAPSTFAPFSANGLFLSSSVFRPGAAVDAIGHFAHAIGNMAVSRGVKASYRKYSVDLSGREHG